MCSVSVIRTFDPDYVLRSYLAQMPPTNGIWGQVNINVSTLAPLARCETMFY